MNELSFLHHFDFFGAEAVQRVDERIHLSFLPSDFGIKGASDSLKLAQDLGIWPGAVLLN